MTCQRALNARIEDPQPMYGIGGLLLMAGSFVVGYFQYFNGLTDLLTNKLFPGFAIVLALWSTVTGWLLYRKGRAPALPG